MQQEHARGGRNQREFRYANTRLLDAISGPSATAGGRGQLIPFLCECADEKCWDSIRITVGRYESIHLDERDYVILPGHLRIAGEEILEENKFYEVVKKAA
jgi:hypothetical protein